MPTSGISEEEENSMILPQCYLYFIWNLKAYRGIILQLEVNKNFFEPYLIFHQPPSPGQGSAPPLSKELILEWPKDPNSSKRQIEAYLGRVAMMHRYRNGLSTFAICEAHYFLPNIKRSRNIPMGKRQCQFFEKVSYTQSFANKNLCENCTPLRTQL
jgi:hypothetical protein